MTLDKLAVIPYQLAARDAIDAALHRLDELESSIRRCLELHIELVSQKHVDPATFAERIRQNTHIRDDLEAFLAAWARLSLLFFPTRNSDPAQQRSQTLQACFALPEDTPLNDRGLRNAWMHFDERLDAAVARGTFSSPFIFPVSAEITAQTLQRNLFVVQLDTGRIHYQGQEGEHHDVLLGDLRGLLTRMEQRWPTAFDSLPMPDGAT